jgi:hypothetical protein
VADAMKNPKSDLYSLTTAAASEFPEGENLVPFIRMEGISGTIYPPCGNN